MMVPWISIGTAGWLPPWFRRCHGPGRIWIFYDQMLDCRLLCVVDLFRGFHCVWGWMYLPAEKWYHKQSSLDNIARSYCFRFGFGRLFQHVRHISGGVGEWIPVKKFFSLRVRQVIKYLPFFFLHVELFQPTHTRRMSGILPLLLKYRGGQPTTTQAFWWFHLRSSKYKRSKKLMRSLTWVCLLFCK